MARVAGIVLAGGRSSRMGTNKALLPYKNVPLIDYMRRLLRQAGVADIYISGDVPGYNCIDDVVRHDGPAQAMHNLLTRFASDYDRFLFVPVDMPLIDVNALSDLIAHEGSVYYDGYPLPVCLTAGGVDGDCHSVRDLLAAKGAQGMKLPAAYDKMMSNMNTKEDWAGITA